MTVCVACTDRLAIDNDREAFRWTSNYQVISVVEMTRHKTLADGLARDLRLPKKIFEIRAAELKTVKRKFKDMVDPASQCALWPSSKPLASSPPKP